MIVGNNYKEKNANPHTQRVEKNWVPISSKKPDLGVDWTNLADIEKDGCLNSRME
ncbi:MAG: hypothetical protein KKC20_21510 [Proteobacteria bacterium]|nr:hypothetical protein [Pseudomonadota bacterium]